MHPISLGLNLLGKAALLTFLGFVALVVLVPALKIVAALLALVLAVATALLPFFLLGLLLWLPWRLAFGQRASRPLVEPAACRADAKGCVPVLVEVHRTDPVVCRPTGSRGSVVRRAGAVTRSAGGIALETVCGGALLVGLALLTKGNIPVGMQDDYLLCAGFGGLLLGLLVGLRNYLPAAPSEAPSVYCTNRTF